LSGGSRQYIGDKEITEVRLLAIRDPFSLRLTALVVRVDIIVFAVQAGMYIAAALWAFIRTRNETLDADFASTLMTDHYFTPVNAIEI